MANYGTKFARGARIRDTDESDCRLEITEQPTYAARGIHGEVSAREKSCQIENYCLLTQHVRGALSALRVLPTRPFRDFER